MNRIVILIVMGFAPLLAAAQNHKGKVTYQEHIKLEFNNMKLEGVENAEAIRAMLPKSRSFKKVLLFSPEASLYRNAEDEQAQGENSVEEGNVQMKVMVARPENEIYRDLKNGKVVEKNDLFGKSFIITDDKDAKMAWKLVEGQKTILGYDCKKAIIRDSSSVTEAWYAPSIPVPAGPMQFGKLPGLVLEVNSDNGRIVITATDIKLGETSAIEPPKKGKQVTREEFRKIAEEKSKEMQESMGGKGNIIIRRGN
jgi:GLPGLI family protein